MLLKKYRSPDPWNSKKRETWIMEEQRGETNDQAME